MTRFEVLAKRATDRPTYPKIIVAYLGSSDSVVYVAVRFIPHVINL